MLGKLLSLTVGAGSRQDTDPILSSNDANRGYCSIEAQPTLSLGDDFEDFGHSYQALRLCLLHLALYYGLAVLAFSFVFEQWKVIDSVYFSTATFTTVGYGDLSPSTDGGRAFTILFAIYGITILGAFLGLAGQVLIERNNAAIEVARKKAQASILKMFSTDDDDNDNAETGPQNQSIGTSISKEILDLLASGAPVAALLLFLALLIAHAENWTFLTGIYWTVVTACTIGYGDLAPKETSVRLACVFFIPFAVVVTGAYVSRVAGVYVARRNLQAEKRYLSRSLTLSNLAAMDSDKDGKVSIEEFLSFTLVALQKVEKDEINQIIALFHKLDLAGNGYLNKNDMILAPKINL